MENKRRYTITLDDDAAIAKIVERITGATSLPFTSSDTLVRKCHSYDPVAVFVDIHLEVQDCGLDAIPQLRKAWPHTPIIVITSNDQDEVVGQALAAGANDFLRKPLTAGELTARLQARLIETAARRTTDVVSVGDVTLCHSLGTLDCNGHVVYLPKLELKLLTVLLECAGMVMSREDVKRRLWGRIVVADNTLDKKISSLRKAFKTIGSDNRIEVSYGEGVAIVLTATKNGLTTSEAV